MLLPVEQGPSAVKAGIFHPETVERAHASVLKRNVIALSHRLANFSGRRSRCACKFFLEWRFFPQKEQEHHRQAAWHGHLEMARVLQKSGITVPP
jgi:hypothetical protein